MSEHLTLPVAFAQFVEDLSKEAGSKLKLLLETKHLYQKTTIDLETVSADVESRVPGDDVAQFQVGVLAILKRDPLTPSRELRFHVGQGHERPSPILSLLLLNSKLFCITCDAREIYTPIFHSEVSNENRKPAVREVQSVARAILRDFQLYVFGFQCQNCHGVPEGFLVRRQGWNLFLEGRSPMEHIDLPPYIPRPERDLFRDALVAAHAGKVLAALFYLRTFIEQFARRLTKLTGRATGDELMDRYSALLPSKERDLMPSLRQWYDRLSEALHSAREDSDLFESARVEIERHFEIRKVFRIAE